MNTLINNTLLLWGIGIPLYMVIMPLSFNYLFDKSDGDWWGWYMWMAVVISPLWIYLIIVGLK